MRVIRLNSGHNIKWISAISSSSSPPAASSPFNICSSSPFGNFTGRHRIGMKFHDRLRAHPPALRREVDTLAGAFRVVAGGVADQGGAIEEALRARVFRNRVGLDPDYLPANGLQAIECVAVGCRQLDLSRWFAGGGCVEVCVAVDPSAVKFTGSTKNVRISTGDVELRPKVELRRCCGRRRSFASDRRNLGLAGDLELARCGSQKVKEAEENQQELERTKIKAMRALLITQDPSSQDVDDLMIRRFLRARDLDIDKASAMLLKYLSWRRESGPISASEVPNELADNKLFMQGHDKLGRPIVLVFGGRHKSKNLEEFKRFVTFTLDTICSRMPSGQEKFVSIADLQLWYVQYA